MTIVFMKLCASGAVVGQTIRNVLGMQVIVGADDIRHPEEIEVRFWFEPSRICTVYWLKSGESVTVDEAAEVSA